MPEFCKVGPTIKCNVNPYTLHVVNKILKMFQNLPQAFINFSDDFESQIYIEMYNFLSDVGNLVVSGVRSLMAQTGSCWAGLFCFRQYIDFVAFKTLQNNQVVYASPLVGLDTRKIL
jgi:hypothetical protein